MAILALAKGVWDPVSPYPYVVFLFAIILGILSQPRSRGRK